MAEYDFKKSHFERLQDYIQSGAKEELSEEETAYLDVLYLLNSMRRKYGKENAIAFIQKPPYNIQYRRARNMYDEAINLFYADDTIERQAHKNMLFEELMSAAKVVLMTAETSKDMEVYGDLVAKAYKIKGLDQPEPPQIPEGIYKKNIKVYTLNPGHIKLEKVDRNALAERIDNMEIKENEKSRLRQEAGVSDIDFIELYDEQEEKTQFET
jgi:hypothetical protein